MLVFGSPFKVTVAHHSIKAGGDSSKTESNICRSDTYIVISNLGKLCRGMNFVLEKEGKSCASWVPGAGVSSFPCSWSETPGIGTLSCKVGQLIN